MNFPGKGGGRAVMLAACLLLCSVGNARWWWQPKELPLLVKVITRDNCRTCQDVRNATVGNTIAIQTETHVQLTDLYPLCIYSNAPADHGERVLAGECRYMSSTEFQKYVPKRKKK
jgi:hypothetical protein